MNEENKKKVNPIDYWKGKIKENDKVINISETPNYKLQQQEPLYKIEGLNTLVNYEVFNYIMGLIYTNKSLYSDNCRLNDMNADLFDQNKILKEIESKNIKERGKTYEEELEIVRSHYKEIKEEIEIEYKKQYYSEIQSMQNLYDIKYRTIVNILKLKINDKIDQPLIDFIKNTIDDDQKQIGKDDE